MRARRIFIGAVAILAFAGTACGSGDDDAAVSGTTEVTEATTTTGGETTTTASTPEATVIDVTATEYAYDVGGVTEVPAGAVEINLTNNGAEEHQATLVRLHEGVDLGALAAAGAADPTGAAALALVDGFGGPTGAAPGGGTATAAANVTPGNYLLICFIPAPDGQPHATKGMVSALTVTEGESAPEPPNDGTIGIKDYEYELPDDFTGQGTYVLDQQGPQAHEMAVYRVNDGSAFSDVEAFFQTAEPAGPPPMTPAGGLGTLQVNGEATVTLDLSPGTYAFLCFVPDVSDSAPHFVHGMLQEVEIS
jgi:hypothetical protein